jgi:adenylosuccinate synthase
MGWFDVPLVLQSLRFNGASSMAIMKLDVLDQLKFIKICVGYTMNGQRLTSPPAMTADWTNLTPVYETLPGWKTSTKNIATYAELPLEAKKYLERLQELCQCPISSVSFGPERDKVLHLHKVFS